MWLVFRIKVDILICVGNLGDIDIFIIIAVDKVCYSLLTLADLLILYNVMNSYELMVIKI